MATPATAAAVATTRVSSVARATERFATKPRPTPSAKRRIVVTITETMRALCIGNRATVIPVVIKNDGLTFLIPQEEKPTISDGQTRQARCLRR